MEPIETIEEMALREEPTPRKWRFQEWLLDWKMWRFGVSTTYGRGWNPDEREIGLGPIRLIYGNWEEANDL